MLVSRENIATKYTRLLFFLFVPCSSSVSHGEKSIEDRLVAHSQLIVFLLLTLLLISLSLFIT